MKEKILSIFKREKEFGKTAAAGSYVVYNTDHRRWQYAPEIYNELEPIIKRDFDVHGKHKIIRTTKQFIIIEAATCNFEIADERGSVVLRKMRDKYLENITIATSRSVYEAHVGIVTDSITLILSVGLNFSGAHSVRIKSNQLTTRFYL